ncbi:WD40 repeat-like protein [Trematosphaeria pertusa]|uniref:Ribosome assembly protein 4 n=1 Tax=Trematosphaeria pertusa TaxID=390896 RepID=A0A6A6HXN7_9PLEO|nr:WD40 repeat-like protein [Trematosphaeria pertusa]KAF2242791.1 WD40 repeat-like protein [Trematosphaeria pertusa]
MATLPPPPSKRQKREALEKSSLQTDLTSTIPDGTIRTRFVDQATGSSDTLPVLTVPLSQATTKNLEILLNELKEQSDDRIPYRFYPDGSAEALGDKEDVYNSLVKTGRVSAESEVVLQYAPQAVFRVKAVSRCSAAVSGHGDNILAVQFSPKNSARMASGSGDKTVRIWDCDTGTPAFTLKGHSKWVLAVSYSPDGSLLASGGYDNEVRIWDPETGKQVGGPLKGHTNFITSLSWEPYHLQEPGRPRVASSSKDGTVRVWDAIGGRVDFALSGHKSSVTCVKWGGTGWIYTSSHDKTIKVWNAETGTLVHTLSGHAHWVNHLALSTDFVLRTSYHDHTRKIPPTPEEKLAKAKSRFEKAAIINGEIVERLATASEDCTIFLWTPLSTSKPVTRMTGHQKQINQVCFSPDGTLLASAAWDNHVKLWSARDGKFLFTLRAHVGPVYMASFSADSRLLASCSKDTTLKVWDMRTGKLKEDLPGHKDQVFALDWSPDGERVGSGGADKQVRIWRG